MSTEFTFTGQFADDVQEAFEYWCSQQKEPKQFEQLSVQKWVANLLKNQIYGLLGSKRIESA